MDIRVGMATGDIVEVDGDCYGDAVNVAARLCERSGARGNLGDRNLGFAGGRCACGMV